MHKYYEEKLGSKTIFDGKVISISLDEARLQNGKTARREVVHHPGGCGVLALNEGGEIAMVRQFRYAAGREMLEIPAGKLEPGENPAHTARRELQEEAGLLADHLEPFGQVLPTCAYCTEIIYLYLATGLHPCAQQLDEDEFLELFWLDLNEAVQLVLSGEIDDAKTVSAVLRAHILRQQGLLPPK